MGRRPRRCLIVSHRLVRQAIERHASTDDAHFTLEAAFMPPRSWSESDALDGELMQSRSCLFCPKLS